MLFVPIFGKETLRARLPSTWKVVYPGHDDNGAISVTEEKEEMNPKVSIYEVIKVTSENENRFWCDDGDIV